MAIGHIKRYEIEKVREMFVLQLCKEYQKACLVGNSTLANAIHEYIRLGWNGFEKFIKKPRTFHVCKNTAGEISSSYQKPDCSVWDCITESRDRSQKHDKPKQVKGMQNSLAIAFDWLMCASVIGDEYIHSFSEPPFTCGIATRPDKVLQGKEVKY